MNQGIEIFKATKEDLFYIQEKIKNYLLDGSNFDLDQFFVARENNRTVGFVRLIERPDFFEVATLGVDYYKRKNGIGLKLLKFIVEEAKQKDSKKPLYGVTNIPQFIAKAGFEVVSDYPEVLNKKINTHFHIAKKSDIRVMRAG